MSIFRPSADELRPILETAQKLAASGQPDDAVALLTVVTGLDPTFEEAVELLDEIRRERPGLRIDEAEIERMRTASHFVGLAQLFSQRGNTTAALECIEMALEKEHRRPRPHKLRAKIRLQQKEYEDAATELVEARLYDPFDIETAESLGIVERELKRYDAAIAASIDAFLLAGDDDSEHARRLRRRIRSLKRLLAWDNRRLVKEFRERQRLLHASFDRLQWRRDRHLEDRGILDRGVAFGTQFFRRGGTRLALASRLRKISQWSDLSDEMIFRLSKITSEETRKEGQVLFRHGSSGRDIYYLESGALTVHRTTPYGTLPLQRVESGAFIGEVNFVDPGARSAEIRTDADSRFLRVDASGLEDLIDDSPELGVEVFSRLWKALAQRVRTANRALTDYVPSTQDELEVEAASAPEHGIQVSVDEKMNLFREQGLETQELMTLASFATERRFPKDAFLFREGDLGNEMFFVLEGKIRISKFIPGTGEEALAILERGDFFGEIALIDGEPRSADARSHEGPVTVVTLTRRDVQRVLDMEPEAGLEFSRLLCRILAVRLREIDERLVMWEILSGHDSDSLTPADAPPSSAAPPDADAARSSDSPPAS